MYKRQLLSTAQVADILGVSPRTVSRWRRAGLIKGFPLVKRPGGTSRGWRFTPEEIQRLIVDLEGGP